MQVCRCTCRQNINCTCILALEGVPMAAIDALLFATAAGFAAIAAATALVIIGVRQEERRQTIASTRPPTIPALLARRVLGAYIQLLPQDSPAAENPADSRRTAGPPPARRNASARPRRGPGRPRLPRCAVA